MWSQPVNFPDNHTSNLSHVHHPLNTKKNFSFPSPFISLQTDHISKARAWRKPFAIHLWTFLMQIKFLWCDHNLWTLLTTTYQRDLRVVVTSNLFDVTITCGLSWESHIKSLSNLSRVDHPFNTTIFEEKLFDSITIYFFPNRSHLQDTNLKKTVCCSCRVSLVRKKRRHVTRKNHWARRCSDTWELYLRSECVQNCHLFRKICFENAHFSSNHLHFKHKYKI